MFLFQLALYCGGYKCRCAEAASKDWQEVTVLTTKGTHLTISLSDTMCLNSSSLHRPSACRDSSTRCKRCGTNKCLETMQKHLSMAQSHLKKPGSIAAFKILLRVILINKDVVSSSKLLQKKKLARVLCAQLAVERSAAAKNSSTPREQRDRTTSSRTLGGTEGSWGKTLQICCFFSVRARERTGMGAKPHYHCWQLKTLQIAWRYVSHQPTNWRKK